MELATTKQQNHAMEEQVRVLQYLKLEENYFVTYSCILFSILVSKITVISRRPIATDSSKIALHGQFTMILNTKYANYPQLSSCVQCSSELFLCVFKGLRTGGKSQKVKDRLEKSPGQK